MAQLTTTIPDAFAAEARDTLAEVAGWTPQTPGTKLQAAERGNRILIREAIRQRRQQAIEAQRVQVDAQVLADLPDTL